jgi:hypothetical protein
MVFGSKETTFDTSVIAPLGQLYSATRKTRRLPDEEGVVPNDMDALTLEVFATGRALRTIFPTLAPFALLAARTRI